MILIPRESSNMWTTIIVVAHTYELALMKFRQYLDSHSKNGIFTEITVGPLLGR